ncbi:hypothetical protein [Pseudoxanthomonas wuyuanensis]
MKTENNRLAAPGTHAEIDEVWAVFLTALGLLPRQMRAAYLLHDIFKADWPEVSAVLGLPCWICRRNVESARRQMQSHVRARRTKNQDSHDEYADPSSG